MPALPKVAVLQTGGTIDSVGRDRLDNAYYIETRQRLEEGELLASVPELARLAAIENVPFRRITSQAFVDRDWLELLRAATDALKRDDICGLVVTHGTNTLEETAYFLNLTVKSRKPVVLVGSMRPSSALSADGYLNLLNAVRVAADPRSVGRGCLVVLNDTIFQARDVTKTSTYRVDAFQSRDLGPLGFADSDGVVAYYHASERPHTSDTEFDVVDLQTLPKVSLVASHVGADGSMVRAAAQEGAQGIVVASTGAGRPTPAEEEALMRLSTSEALAVCIASRIGSGRVVRSPGFKRNRFVASDNLVPWKATVLLSLALTVTSDPDAIQRIFDTY